MDELGESIHDFEKQDIKSTPMTFEQIDEMRNLSGSYETLFSRKAMKYRSMGLNEKNLTEDDYRTLIQQEYTFLKRPVFVINEKIFIGNAKKTTESIKAALS